MKRASNYIERLPEIIDREEEDISHLDPQMVEILYPSRAPREFTVSVVFGPPSFDDEQGAEHKEAATRNYEKAVALAEKARGYRTEGSDQYLRHYATYGIDEVRELYELFSLVGDEPGSEILVKGKKVPYARELWLPFFWFFRKE